MILVSASSSFYNIFPLHFPSGEHQMELLDYVAAKFHEEAGIFKLLVQAFKYCSICSYLAYYLSSVDSNSN